VFLICSGSATSRHLLEIAFPVARGKGSRP
jgi:hypothetical protein